MKISWIFWWIVTAFWIALFAVGTGVVWLREVDGPGAAQTPEIKFISFIVLLFAFILPAIIQVIWLIINIVVGRKKQSNINDKGYDAMS